MRVVALVGMLAFMVAAPCTGVSLTLSSAKKKHKAPYVEVQKVQLPDMFSSSVNGGGAPHHEHKKKKWRQMGPDLMAHIKTKELSFPMGDSEAEGLTVNRNVQGRMSSRVLGGQPAYNPEGGAVVSAAQVPGDANLFVGNGNSEPPHGPLMPTMHLMNIDNGGMTQWMSVQASGPGVGRVKDGVIPLDDGRVMIRTIKEGKGDLPAFGETVTVHYVGKLDNGRVFESSRATKTPRSFDLGVGNVIPCWDTAVAEMRLGERAIVKCKSEVAWGSHGQPSTGVPPDADVTFDIERVSDFADSEDGPQ